MEQARLGVADIVPLTDLVATSPDDTVVARALTALATVDLETEAWATVDSVVRARLDGDPSPAIVSAAAQVPLRSVRAVLRDLATARPAPDTGSDAGSGTDLARAALFGLAAAHDHETLVDRFDDVAERFGWQELATLPATDLAAVAPSVWSQSDERQGDLFFVVAAGKAGHLGPLRRLLDAIAAGNSPELFWGSPMYAASLLEPARPIPPAMERTLMTEWNSIEDNLSDRHREVTILVEGLIGLDEYPW